MKLLLLQSQNPTATLASLLACLLFLIDPSAPHDCTRVTTKTRGSARARQAAFYNTPTTEKRNMKGGKTDSQPGHTSSVTRGQDSQRCSACRKTAVPRLLTLWSIPFSGPLRVPMLRRNCDSKEKSTLPRPCNF